jgi:hypothetical protein
MTEALIVKGKQLYFGIITVLVMIVIGLAIINYDSDKALTTTELFRSILTYSVIAFGLIAGTSTILTFFGYTPFKDTPVTSDKPDTLDKPDTSDKPVTNTNNTPIVDTKKKM